MSKHKNIEEKKISDTFESSFLSRSIEKQLELCDKNEFASVFNKYLGKHQPILEAGCGSGRWVAWFANKGWRATGIDWSEKLMERAQKEIPNAEFVAVDIRNTPFEDRKFGSVVSLGAIEHSIDGPMDCLNEHNRILSDDGVMILSVPFGSNLRKLVFPFKYLTVKLKANNFIRKITGKNLVKGEPYRSVKKTTINKWFPLISLINCQWQFYEYRFSRKQLTSFLYESGFQIDEVLFLFSDQGLLHTFGKIVGSFNYSSGKVNFSLIGKILNFILPKRVTAHHICFVASKKYI